MINKVMYSSDKDDWETPQDLFDSISNEIGGFDLDVAANAVNHKCQAYFTKENSAFENEWFGNVWCNPPYGREIGKWVQKCSEYKGLSVMLIPARTDTKWFHDYIYHNPRAEFRFLRGRLHFNNSKNAAPFPSMVVIFRSGL